MYPMNVFAMFPPFPRRDTVFVVMDFDERFGHRWNNVIRPGIQKVTIGNNRLEAVRIDDRNISDSIMTEILLQISQARLVLGDISSVGKIGDTTVRNSNVMYEVGLAQAVRLPEEVILVRSDEDDLPFDVQSVRVNKYFPEHNPEGAADVVAGLVHEALKQVQLAKAVAVKQALEKLDFQSWYLLTEGLKGPIKHPQNRTIKDAMSYGATKVPSLLRLLDMGLVKMHCGKITPERFHELTDTLGEEMFNYEITQFGLAVLDAYGRAAAIHELPRDFMESLKVEFSNRNKGDADKQGESKPSS